MSDLFDVLLGLMQGEALSPLLFSMFVDDLEFAFMTAGCTSLDIGVISMFLLLYADDTVLLSESAEGLQKMLDTLEN